MSSLKKIVRLEPAGSSIMFRERPYVQVEKQSFVRDILGLANALVDGARYLVLGVKDDSPNARGFVGLSGKEVADAQDLYSGLLDRYVEPKLEFGFDVLELDGATVVILSLHACDSPPYLLKENLSNSMREGSGWIMRSAVPARLRRADLQKLFEKTLFGPERQPKIQIGFPGKKLTEELNLPVLDLDGMPSKLAGEKFCKLMEVKQAAHDAGSRTTTHIERLVHMREFGGTAPFEKISETSLNRRLGTIKDEHHWADDYYEFETQTHKVNLSIANLGEAAVREGLLMLDLPRVDGFGVSDYLRTSEEEGDEDPTDYPSVDVGEKTIRVQTSTTVVAGGTTVQAFRVPLRVWVRDAVVGQMLPVDFRMIGGGLSEPVTGTLRIHCR